MPARPYKDFDLFFEPADTGVRLRLGAPATPGVPSGSAPKGEVIVPLATPLEAGSIEQHLGQMGVRAARDAILKRAPADDEAGRRAARELGDDLYRKLLPGPLGEAFARRLDEARRDGCGLRLRLHLTKTPDLAAIPWEYLHAEERGFLTASSETPVVRFLDLRDEIWPLRDERPLRILVAIATPESLGAIDAESEWRLIQESLADLVADGSVEIERLVPATLDALQALLLKGRYHVLHFIGHGDDGAVVFEDGDGGADEVPQESLATLLQDHETLRLAVLNACLGGKAPPRELFAGVAQCLVQRGIPAVIAMQFALEDGAARKLARSFYLAIAHGYPVDAALAEGRKALYLDRSAGVAWGAPVLYTRVRDGAVFTIVPRSSAPAGPQTPTLPVTPTGPQTPTLPVTPTGPQTPTLPVGPVLRPTPSLPDVAAELKSPRVLDWSTGPRPLVPIGDPAIPPVEPLGPALTLEVPLRPEDVMAVAFSAHGKYALTGNAQALHVWEVDSRARVWIARNAALAAAFSPNGARIAAGGADDTPAVVLDFPAGDVHTPLEGSAGFLRGLRFSADGTSLFAARGDAVLAWDADTGARQPGFEGHDAEVTAFALGRSGRLVAACADGSLHLWASVTRERLRGTRLSTNGFAIVTVGFTSDETTVVALDEDGFAHRWSLGSGEAAPTHAHLGLRPAALNTQSSIVLGEGPGGAETVDLETGERRLFGGPAHQAAFLADGSLALAAGWNGAWLLTLDGDRKPEPLGEQPLQTVALSISADGSTVLTGGEASLRRWSLQTGECQSIQPAGGYDYVQSPDGRQVLVLGWNGEITRWTPGGDSGALLFDAGAGGIPRLALSPDRPEGGLLAFARRDALILLDPATGQTRRIALGDVPAPVCFAFDRHGARLVTTHEDTAVRVWSTETGALLTSLAKHEHPPAALAVCPVRDTCVSAAGKIILAWRFLDRPPLHAVLPRRPIGADSPLALSPFERLESGLRRIVVPLDPVSALAFSPDGEWLCVGGAAGSIGLYHTRTCEPAFPSRLAHESGVRAVGLTPDNRLLVSAGRDRTTRVFSAATGEQLALFVAFPGGERAAVTEHAYRGTDFAHRHLSLREGLQAFPADPRARSLRNPAALEQALSRAAAPPTPPLPEAGDRPRRRPLPRPPS